MIKRKGVAGFIRLAYPTKTKPGGHRKVVFLCPRCNKRAAKRPMTIRVNINTLGGFEQTCNRCGKDCNPFAEKGTGQLYA